MYGPQSLSAARFTAALSSLKAANKQPQLALELIMQSIGSQQAAGAAHSSPQPGAKSISPSRVPGFSGSVIDSYV